jgi:hypothetical protein
MLDVSLDIICISLIYKVNGMMVLVIYMVHGTIKLQALFFRDWLYAYYVHCFAHSSNSINKREEMQDYFQEPFYRTEPEVTLTSLVRIVQDLEECIEAMIFI